MDELQEAMFLTCPPLIKFSVYTQSQVECLKRVSDELWQLLDEDGGLGSNFQRIYGNFWIWVLGAYEVSRTISEYKHCFSERLNTDVMSFKKRIAILRMPFAKQQYRGNDKRTINGEASVYDFDSDTKDIAFEVEGDVIWLRVLIAEFDRLVESISHADVLQDLRVAPVQ